MTPLYKFRGHWCILPARELPLLTHTARSVQSKNVGQRVCAEFLLPAVYLFFIK